MVTLVTGATGLVGNNVVRMLLDSGQEVRVLVREGCDPRPLQGLAVESCTGDIRDEAAVARAAQGVEQVVHAAATVQVGWTGLQSSRAVNVQGTRNVAQAAREAGARMCHVSSVDALGISHDGPADEETPVAGTVDCPYVVTKREAEAVIQEEVALGLHAFIVNPTYMLGRWDWKPSSGRMLLAVASGQARLAPPGANDFCHVEDVAAGILTVLERGKVGRRYILGSEALSYREAWSQMASVVGRGTPWGTAWKPVLTLAGLAGDAVGRMLGQEPDINSASVAMSCLPHTFSHARAASELGYSPRPMREGVQDAWEFFQSYGYV